MNKVKASWYILETWADHCALIGIGNKYRQCIVWLYIMRSHKFWYSALWLCSKVFYKPDWYISFVSIFNQPKSKWKSLHWPNFSSRQFMLCQLMICPPKCQQKCQPKKNHHLKRLWTVSPEEIRKQCWSKIKSVLFLQVKSTQFKTFW